jgi:hypothetical protein
METASNAGSRTESWSIAKREFAQRATASGSFTEKSTTLASDSQSIAASQQAEQKKK